MTELQARFDARKSFYGKAKVDLAGGKVKLYSYGTLVAEIIPVYENSIDYGRRWKAVVYGTYSQTTLRHIKEFLKQNGFRADSKAQIEKDYMN